MTTNTDLQKKNQALHKALSDLIEDLSLRARIRGDIDEETGQVILDVSHSKLIAAERALSYSGDEQA